MKTIVTHLSPDVDAVSSVWLLKRFLPAWKDAQVAFVPAGKTLHDDPPDQNPNILHVDTGMGKLDHHQTDEDTCAARRTLEFIEGQPKAERAHVFHKEALTRLVDVVNDIDHFREVYFPNPTADFYEFGLVPILDGLKFVFPDNHQKIVEIGMLALDAIYKKFQDKVWAEEEIAKNAVSFTSPWGKGLAIETLNDEVVPLIQKQGNIVAVRKDPKKGYVRIKALPESPVDLTACYNRFRKLDPAATWFLHASRKMVLNGSVKNPDSKPTTLTLREIVEVLEK